VETKISIIYNLLVQACGSKSS